jgi:hypothetical protein
MTNIFNAYHVVQIEPGLWRVNEETFDVYERARSYAAFMNEETPIDYAARIAELEAQLAAERENVAHLKKMLKRANEYIRRFSKHEMYYNAWRNGVEPDTFSGGKS